MPTPQGNLSHSYQGKELFFERGPLPDFGDPLHSRPLPLNFSARGDYSEANPAI